MTSRPQIRTAARLVLEAVFLGAGLLHLMIPGPFVRITPAWVPQPALVVALTGIAEVLGAAGLMIPRLRVAAGQGVALDGR